MENLLRNNTLSSTYNSIINSILSYNNALNILRQPQHQYLHHQSTASIGEEDVLASITSVFLSSSTTTSTFATSTSTSTPTPTGSSISHILSSSKLIASLFTTTIPNIIKRYEHVNQLQKFTNHQAFVQRIVATSSSCASIASVLIAILFFIRIDPKRLVFRHHLIFFLLMFDLLKAVILLIYPTRVLTHSTSYYNKRFCQVVGFFTAFSIEGADIAILAFALHTYLLIFKPNLNTKVPGTNRVEGGLYKLRFLVYSLSFFVPIIFASLAFINNVGYDSLVCWCYLPMRPVWFRLVLSWVPRYFIIVSIFVIYGLIYFRVIKEFKTLGGVFTNIHQRNAGYMNNNQPSFWSSFKFFIGTIKDHLFPQMILSNKSIKTIQSRNSNTQQQQSDLQQHQSHHSRIEGNYNSEEYNDSLDLTDSDSEDVDDLEELELKDFENSNDMNNNLHFQKRHNVIHKQMKKIFVYPFAYCFLWLFPFILQATQFNYEIDHKPIYWLNVLGAFFQPFNGVVDSAVFFYREKPWKYTRSRVKERERIEKEELDRKYDQINNLSNTTNTYSTFQKSSQPNNEIPSYDFHNSQDQSNIQKQTINHNMPIKLENQPPSTATTDTKSSPGAATVEDEDDELDFTQFLKS
ncbi:GPR1 [Candida pseudojiufengensis]|uniref:GPR1 n=1 Tax=Candida pseudojiufengensis TaxID=497109 RepID=UPI0022254E57|nr:GPR1 [Candida pseudojiufengensis]KAI5964327.1 GPR1 [Candida pseudojiufengensis]